jgi:hypothetical protein
MKAIELAANYISDYIFNGVKGPDPYFDIENSEFDEFTSLEDMKLSFLNTLTSNYSFSSIREIEADYIDPPFCCIEITNEEKTYNFTVEISSLRGYDYLNVIVE